MLGRRDYMAPITMKWPRGSLSYYEEPPEPACDSPRVS